MALNEFYRSESRYQFKSSEAPVDQFGNEVIYGSPYVSTIYFGSNKGFLNGRALKARIYSNKGNSTPFILDDNQFCILELKLNPRNSISDRRRKFRIEGRLGDFINALSSTENLSTLNEYKLRGSDEHFPSQLLSFLANKEGIVGFIPIGATSYRRRHFSKSTTRLTVDSEISFWKPIQFYKDWYIIKAGSMGEEIVEIKESYPQQNTSVIFSFEQAGTAEPAKSKFELMSGVFVSSNYPVIINPEMLGGIASGDWDLIEREFKLDLNGDGRDIFAKYKSSEAYSISRIYPTISYQQFYYPNDVTVCTMGKGGWDHPEVIKIKRTIETDDNMLTRQELIIPYSQDSLARVLRESGANIETTEKSKPFVRHRLQKNILCRESGNIFNIVVDYCQAEHNDMPPLYQVEVEFHGALGLTGSIAVDFNRVIQDFWSIENMLIRYFTENGFDSKKSTLTKSEWIAGKAEGK